MYRKSNLDLIKKTFLNKKILITGNTGFKGVWLSKFLEQYTSKIYGISYNQNFKNDKLFNKIKKYLAVKNYNINICDPKKLNLVVKNIQPDYLIHFAAQSLVLKSWSKPNLNFDNNVIGSINIIKSIKKIQSIKKVFLVTTDKVYLNETKNKKFEESDPLGGNDPYSLSKTISDLIFQYYIRFIIKKKIDFYIIRSGNIYGGGDFAENRLIPDYYKSKKKFIIRNYKSTRPYQFILDVIFSYLLIMTKKIKNPLINVGPDNSLNTLKIIKKFNSIHKKKKILAVKKRKTNLEKKFLSLSTSKFKKLFKWKSQIKLSETIKMTDKIYSNFYRSGKYVNSIMKKQIQVYINKQ